jgi:AcrR family transcriptional regulator
MTQEPAQPHGRHRIGTDDPAAGGQTARARIQDVALDLFIEEGYDKTSLREIAERLGVTKAALYYHFPTKQDILSSMIDDRVEQLKVLIEWGREQPRTEETRRELVHRYADMLQGGRHFKIMQFFERNQTVAKTLQSGDVMRTQMIDLVDLLSDPTDPPALQLRRSIAIFAIHASWFVFSNRDVSEETSRDAGLKVALDLVSGPDPATTSPK